MTSALMRGQFTRFSGLGGGAEFPDPFMDVASLSIPQNIRSALYWCEFIWNYHGTYRMAMERIISYFLTDVIIDGASEDERTKWEEYLRDDLDIIGEIQKALRNRMCYGNGFSSVVVPFRRFLNCPKCGYQAPLKEIFENKVFNFSWSMPDFIATCPVCKTRGKESYRGPWKVKDEKDETKIKVKHWNVHEIELLHDLYTEDVHYIWRIPEDYRRQIRQGNLFHLERVDMEVLKAVQHNQVFRFHPDSIYHMKEPTLSGMINRGWHQMVYAICLGCGTLSGKLLGSTKFSKDFNGIFRTMLGKYTLICGFVNVGQIHDNVATLLVGVHTDNIRNVVIKALTASVILAVRTGNNSIVPRDTAP